MNQRHAKILHELYEIPAMPQKRACPTHLFENEPKTGFSGTADLVYTPMMKKFRYQAVSGKRISQAALFSYNINQGVTAIALDIYCYANRNSSPEFLPYLLLMAQVVTLAHIHCQIAFCRLQLLYMYEWKC